MLAHTYARIGCVGLGSAQDLNEMRTKVDQVRTRAKDMQQQRDLQDRVHQLRATMGWALVAEKEAVRAPNEDDAIDSTVEDTGRLLGGPLGLALQGTSAWLSVPSLPVTQHAHLSGPRPPCPLFKKKQEVKACEEERDELALGAEHYEAKRQRAAVRPGTARPVRRGC